MSAVIYLFVISSNIKMHVYSFDLNSSSTETQPGLFSSSSYRALCLWLTSSLLIATAPKGELFFCFVCTVITSANKKVDKSKCFVWKVCVLHPRYIPFVCFRNRFVSNTGNEPWVEEMILTAYLKERLYSRSLALSFLSSSVWKTQIN